MINQHDGGRIQSLLEDRTLRFAAIDAAIDAIVVGLQHVDESMTDADKLLAVYQMQLRQVSGVKLQSSWQARLAVIERICSLLNVNAEIDKGLGQSWNARAPLAVVAGHDTELMINGMNFYNERVSRSCQ